MAKIPIPLNEILFLKADSNYTEFHLLGGKKELSPRTLKHHQSSVSLRHFLRVNNSFLLNPSYIDSITRRKSVPVVHLTDGTEIRVSRRRKNVLEMLKIGGSLF